MPALQIIDDALLLQSFQKTPDVVADLRRISAAVRRRKRRHNLLHGALAITQLQDFLPSPLDPNHAFRKQYDSFFALRAPAAASGKMRLACVGRRSHAQDSPI